MKQDPFQKPVHSVVIPDLGAGQNRIQLVCWLVPANSQVISGERIAEILSEGVVFHLEAPEEGVLAKLRASAGEAVVAGQVIAEIREA